MRKEIKEALNSALTYESYRALIKERLYKNQSTGNNHSEDLVNYTSLNDHRMDRIDKTSVILPEVLQAGNRLQKDYIWLLITEGWCGDAAQSVPVIAKIADKLPNVELKIVLRDEHPEIMDMYLTNGGRSIPKLIAFTKEDLKEVGTWGPRPAIAQEMVMKYKALENKPPYSEFVKTLQLWYAKDKTHAIQNELTDFILQHENSGQLA